MSQRPSLSVFQVVFLAMCLAVNTRAQIPAPEEFHDVTVTDQARDMYKELWSPFCPGFNLHDCTSGQAASLRKTIALKFQEGKSKDQVVTELQELYGETLSMVPPPSPLRTVAYSLPFILAVLALLWLLRRVVAPGRRSPKTGPLSQSLTEKKRDDIQRWLDQ